MKLLKLTIILLTISMSMNAQTKSKLPFVGVRYFNFLGGSGTGESIRINSDGTCIIIGYGAGIGTKPTLVYEGQFKNPLMVEYNSDESLQLEFQAGYLIKGTKIYRLNKKGKIERDCMGDGKECSSTLDK